MTTVVATGTFEILHPGHILFLKEAKKLGDKLVVIVSTDRNVRKRKGRILISQKQRLAVINSLKFVDDAIVGDDGDIFKPIGKIKPDIIVLGKNQKFNKKNFLSGNFCARKTAKQFLGPISLREIRAQSALKADSGEKELEIELRNRGLTVKVVRIKKFWKGELNSSSRIIEKIKNL